MVQVPLAFWAVTVSPRDPDKTQSVLLVENVRAPVPVPPDAVSAVATPKTRLPPENVGAVPVPLLMTRGQLVWKVPKESVAEKV